MDLPLIPRSVSEPVLKMEKKIARCRIDIEELQLLRQLLRQRLQSLWSQDRPLRPLPQKKKPQVDKILKL